MRNTTVTAGISTLILAALALFLIKVQVKARTPSPFIVQRVSFARLLAQSNQQPHISLTAWVKSQGTKPRWWGKNSNLHLQTLQFVATSGRSYNIKPVKAWRGRYDGWAQQYFVSEQGAIPELANVPAQGTLEGTLLIEGNAVPFSVPIKAKRGY